MYKGNRNVRSCPNLSSTLKPLFHRAFHSYPRSQRLSILISVVVFTFWSNSHNYFLYSILETILQILRNPIIHSSLREYMALNNRISRSHSSFTTIGFWMIENRKIKLFVLLFIILIFTLRPS